MASSDTSSGIAITGMACRFAGSDGLISSAGSAVRVRVIPTNEELMIARHLESMTGAAPGCSD